MTNGQVVLVGVVIGVFSAWVCLCVALFSWRRIADRIAHGLQLIDGRARRAEESVKTQADRVIASINETAMAMNKDVYASIMTEAEQIRRLAGAVGNIIDSIAAIKFPKGTTLGRRSKNQAPKQEAEKPKPRRRR